MLFAAGLGTRMAPLTAHLPKPLIEVAGHALIDHAFRQIDAAGHVTRVVVNLHYLPGLIRSHLGDRPGVLFSDETSELLETGGGLKAALPLLGDGPVHTMNTDAVWSGGNPLTELSAAWDAPAMDALLLLVPKEQAIGHLGKGDFDMAPDGRLMRGTRYVYTGAQIIQATGVSRMPGRVFSLNPVWDAMMAEGRLFGTLHRGGFCDVGRPECIALAESHMQNSGHV